MPKTSKPLRKIPEFKSEDEEHEFWAKHDTVDYIDWRKARFARFPNLRPSTRTISIRLPESMIDQLKILANKRDIPYQSLLKMYVAEGLQKESR